MDDENNSFLCSLICQYIVISSILIQRFIFWLLQPPKTVSAPVRISVAVRLYITPATMIRKHIDQQKTATNPLQTARKKIRLSTRTPTSQDAF
ncbi:hypothetical protein VTI28DRAFT_8898 [Corynascus sepedonium]